MKLSKEYRDGVGIYKQIEQGYDRTVHVAFGALVTYMGSSPTYGDLLGQPNHTHHDTISNTGKFKVFIGYSLRPGQ